MNSVRAFINNTFIQNILVRCNLVGSSNGMMKLIIALLTPLYLFIPINSASAHVLITDETNTKGAILHIIPDDDPIAGEQATLYFDAQNQLIQADSSVTLTIKDENGNEKEVETKIDDSLVTANFTFPEQGVYNVTYAVVSNGNTHVFNQSQRVSRGLANTDQVGQTYAWAESLLVASGISFAFLFIVAFNRRKDIARQSKL